jgi:hypothetical protein
VHRAEFRAQLRYQNPIADTEGWLHRPRRDREGLNDVRAKHDGQYYGTRKKQSPVE